MFLTWGLDELGSEPWKISILKFKAVVIDGEFALFLATALLAYKRHVSANEVPFLPPFSFYKSETADIDADTIQRTHHIYKISVE